jgi:hypothetical protein
MTALKNRLEMLIYPHVNSACNFGLVCCTSMLRYKSGPTPLPSLARSSQLRSLTLPSTLRAAEPFEFVPNSFVADFCLALRSPADFTGVAVIRTHP